MSFRQAVESTPGLGQAALRPGLQALGAHSGRVRCRDTRRLKGSVDVDAALAAADSHGARWDYAVGYRGAGADRVYWIEVHEASPHGVTVVLGKLAWLHAWLEADGHRLKPLTKQYVWISSGRTTYLRSSQAARRLAQAGVLQAGRTFTIG
jgi:hypothetical protein